jgi:hypothetical protein
MDPVIARQAPGVPATKHANGSAQPESKSRSKFDTIRDQDRPDDQKNGVGPNASSSRSDRQELLKHELRKKLDAHPSRKPAEVFGDDLKATRSSLNQLKKRVEAAPSSSAVDQIKTRLADLDMQFQKADSAIEGMDGPASPKQLLKLQTDMYELSENLGIVSKMTDQVTSGIKSILQTQV